MSKAAPQSPHHPDPEPGTFLSIGATAEATGISSETLRIWERRYGRPVPQRRPSGHRRYSAAQVIWLRRVAEALARGHRPGQVVRMSDEELDALLRAETAQPEPTRPEIARMLDAVRRFDGERFLAEIRKAWEANPPLVFLEEVMGPLAEEVGRAWADGRLEVRHEHYASGIMEDFLRMVRAQYVCYSRPPRVLLAALSGELHSLAVQMTALTCAVEGIHHRVLGVDCPTAEIVAAVRESNADVVAISVSLASGGVDNDRALAELRNALPDPVALCVGGAGARGVRGGPRGVLYLDDLSGWSNWLRQSRRAAG